ncbi:hypothetical protein BS47DRAFT_1484873 [Hydnum rufescens UP504]|uniref:Uncharacterized protein n=1 Tax=Hydnum rufescens UP504 TaxID=1448309 RepID=A0A9P6AZL8_9AGAM|nr:hypothetical protein BS47DRAFT_1484873 [Hydnum rufescens UP504]
MLDEMSSGLLLRVGGEVRRTPNSHQFGSAEALASKEAGLKNRLTACTSGSRSVGKTSCNDYATLSQPRSTEKIFSAKRLQSIISPATQKLAVAHVPLASSLTWSLNSIKPSATWAEAKILSLAEPKVEIAFHNNYSVTHPRLSVSLEQYTTVCRASRLKPHSGPSGNSTIDILALLEIVTLYIHWRLVDDLVIAILTLSL